jgi:hypothetical protein
MATARMGLGAKSEGQLLITGTKGYILVEAPWWKTQGFEVRFEDQNLNEKSYTKFLGEGLRYEAADFVKRIWDCHGDSFKLSAENSVAMAGVLGEFLRTRKGGTRS